ncbi:MAG: hypothetical protein LBL72_04685 [Candidatus Accumulibacter sp.]|jgi:uncharacterized protein|nr:hypothetical protein [Accumulibacter sp.]
MRQAFLILLVLVVFFLLRRKSTPRARRRAPGDDRPERMVECARCGVNLPISESIRARGRYYCSEDHRERDA